MTAIHPARVLAECCVSPAYARDIAAELGRYQSHVRRRLHVLRALGLVRRVAGTNRYEATALGHAAMAQRLRRKAA